MKTLIKAQFGILLAGTIFAWTNFTIELLRWMNNQANPYSCNPNQANPFLTPCFYGAIVFTVAFVVSILMLLNLKEKKSDES